MIPLLRAPEASAGADQLELEPGEPAAPRIKRPCAVVVSAHVSLPSPKKKSRWPGRKAVYARSHTGGEISIAQFPLHRL